MKEERVIPIAADPGSGGACEDAEVFALMVLGDSMAPEFVEGEIIVIEPSGVAEEGSYVLAQVDGEWIFRQLAKVDDGWQLRPLNAAYVAANIADLACVRGVIVQKTKPGRRKAVKRYVE
jgi:DNA polymerase V